MYQFRNSRIEAIRHVVTPSVSVRLVPEIEQLAVDYNKPVLDKNGEAFRRNGQVLEYSPYAGRPNGVPGSSKKSGSVSVGLKNTLEMKLWPKSDSAKKAEKVSILRNLNFNSSYDIFKDSLRWSNISISANTQLFKGKLDVNYSGTASPYSLDSNNRAYEQYYFEETGMLAKLTSSRFSAGISFRSGQGTKAEDDDPNTTEDDNQLNPSVLNANVVNPYSGGYVDFSIPWSIRLGYDLSVNYKDFKNDISSHTLRLNGDFNLTSKWKVAYSSGYDIQQKKITATNFRINRDLHCWEMSLNLNMFYGNPYWEFKINAKSAILQDLKWDKKQPQQDY
ncbi:MAG: hypothetical protein HC896_05620 [Bacteroidales bacterium]|nr:hypothetical protein [Bacteroidales bacterium]